MGRLSKALGKLGSWFCFPSAKKKSSLYDLEMEVDDPNCGLIDECTKRVCHVAPNNATDANFPNEATVAPSAQVAPKSSLSNNGCPMDDTLKSECVSGARKETKLINWKVHDFLALCELKDLLRNENCIFTAGHTLSMPTRWCFNLQRMKNDDNIGLFLKRVQPLSIHELTGKTNASEPCSMVRKKPIQDDTLVTLANTKDEDFENNVVHIHYECIIRRSGYGDVWIHKRTCIPNFNINQRLGFRRLFSMEEFKSADDMRPKPTPLLGEDNTLHLEIKFSLHLSSVQRSRSELNLMQSFSMECTKKHHVELLQEAMKNLFISGLNSDLTLVVDEKEIQKETTFHVHKGVLAARSPVFAAMLRPGSGMTESTARILRINDVSATAMRSVLSYIYSGTTDDTFNWKSVGDVQELIYAADKYAVLGLLECCDRMMFYGCDLENAMQLLLLAQMHCLNVASREISVYIKMNANKIFQTEVTC